MLITNLSEVIAQLKPRLPEYLAQHKINPDKKFKCLNPNHKEDTPSASMNKKANSEYVHCFGCNSTYDIFAVASWLEGLPAEGIDWIAENVLVLAKKFDIEVNLGELSERQQYVFAVQRAYSHASEYVISNQTEWPKVVEDYISMRKWPKAKLTELGVGVGTKEGLQEYMLKLGYSLEYLREINLISSTNQAIVDNALIFTLYDEGGRPIGFTARQFDEGTQKYMSTTSAGLQFELPKKGDSLYGIHLARKNKSEALYIFEGQGDVVSAQLQGMMNCCAVGGTALTQGQINLIRAIGFKQIILMFDFDEAGYNATYKALEGLLKSVRDIHVYVSDYQGELKDPGELIEKEGIRVLKDAQTIKPFTWLLNYYSDSKTGQELANDMIPAIANEPSAITREIYTKELSIKTGISINSIDLEIRKLLDNAVHQLDLQERELVEFAWDEMAKFPSERSSILSKAIRELEELKDKYTVGKFSAGSCVALLDEEKKLGDEANANTVVGFNMPLLKDLQKCFAGGKDWSRNTLMMLGGPENAGKSSLLAFKATNIAWDNSNDAVAIYFSIDDSARDILPKFISSANCLIRNEIGTDEVTELPLGLIENPKIWLMQSMLTDPVKEKLLSVREQAYQATRQLMTNERLVIKDAMDGSTLDFIEAAVRYYRNRYPSKKIFAVLDNTHNLSDFQDKDTNDRYKRIADSMNNISNRYSICFMASVEYRKQMSGVRSGNKILPSNDDIAESRAFKYRAKWIGHIYNDMHSRPEEYDTFHIHPRTRDHLPRILLLHGKTKINGFKGITVLDFFPGQSAFRFKSESEAKLEAIKYLESKEETDTTEDETW